MASAWDTDEIALDPTRLTLVCGTAGYDGTAFKGLLADRYDIQLNKTSRNSILLQTNINNTRSDVAHLIRVLAEIAHDIDTQLRRGGEQARLEFEKRVEALMKDVPDLPNFSNFQATFRDNANSATSEGHMREAFYAAYRAENCEYLAVNSPEMDQRLEAGAGSGGRGFRDSLPARIPDHGAGAGHHQRHHHVHAQTRCEGNPRLSRGARTAHPQERATGRTQIINNNWA